MRKRKLRLRMTSVCHKLVYDAQNRTPNIFRRANDLLIGKAKHSEPAKIINSASSKSVILRSVGVIRSVDLYKERKLFDHKVWNIVQDHSLRTQATLWQKSTSFPALELAKENVLGVSALLNVLFCECSQARGDAPRDFGHRNRRIHGSDIITTSMKLKDFSGVTRGRTY